MALTRAKKDVEAERARPVPKHLRDSHSATGRKQKDDSPYLYPHDYPEGYVPQQYIPEGVQTQPYYEPTEHGKEAAIKKRLEMLRAQEEPTSG